MRRGCGPASYTAGSQKMVTDSNQKTYKFCFMHASSPNFVHIEENAELGFSMGAGTRPPLSRDFIQ